MQHTTEALGMDKKSRRFIELKQKYHFFRIFQEYVESWGNVL